MESSSPATEEPRIPTQQDKTTAGSLAKQAEEALAENDVAKMTELCLEALELDPDCRRALSLMARYGGWNEETLELNLDLALNAARRSLELADSEARAYLASKIYYERRDQVAKQLDALMKIAKGAEPTQVHVVMTTWRRLMEETPYLPAEVMNDEVEICEDLCRKSKRSLFPNERVLAQAYTEFNDGVSYADTLRSIAQARSGEAEQHEQAALNEVQSRYEACMASYRERSEGASLSPAEERTLITDTLKQLDAVLKDLGNISERPIYEEMRERLTKHQEGLKSIQLLQARKTASTLSTVEAKLAEIDAAFAPIVDPVQAQADKLRARLTELTKKR